MLPILVSYVSLDSTFSQALGTIGFNTDQPADLGPSLIFIFKLGIMICVLAAGIMYMWAGFVRLKASEQAIRKSNEIMKRATYGLVGVLSLVIIGLTINKDILNIDVPLKSLRANSPTGLSAAPKTSTSSTPTIPANNDDPEGWAAIQRDPQIRAQLAALPNGGITVNKSVCTTPTQTGCTTVGWKYPDTPNMLAQLRNTCSGSIEITGGTEAGHKSHGPTLRPVDLSMNKPGGLNDCVRSFPKGPSLGFCKATYTQFGYVFCDEYVEGGTPHWHVQ